jgi:hypothetical protein
VTLVHSLQVMVIYFFLQVTLVHSLQVMVTYFYL